MESDWLSTSEAAAALGVSEASVRRWGDRGRLPVLRLGRRRERRFRAEHVEAFRESLGAPVAPSGSPAGMTEVRFGRVTYDVHTHLATFYDSDAGRLRMTAPFLEEGLRAGQPCFLVAGGELLNAYLERLRKAPGVDVDAAVRSGLLTIVKGRGARIEGALRFWEDACWAKIEAGATVIRAVAEMVSEREFFVSEAEMLAYEAVVNPVVKRFPCFVVCQYDVRQFSGPALMTALRAHPDLLDMPVRSLIT